MLSVLILGGTEQARELAGRLAADGRVRVVTSLAGTGAAATKHISFRMVRSAGAVTAGCIPHARARVTVTSRGPVEVMRVHARGLPENTEFDLFVIQVPNAPFGLSWYQGDLETNAHGRADGVFIGRFNIETFVVAPDLDASVAEEALIVGHKRVFHRLFQIRQIRLLLVRPARHGRALARGPRARHRHDEDQRVAGWQLRLAHAQLVAEGAITKHTWSFGPAIPLCLPRLGHRRHGQGLARRYT